MNFDSSFQCELLKEIVIPDFQKIKKKQKQNVRQNETQNLFLLNVKVKLGIKSRGGHCGIVLSYAEINRHKIEGD